MSETAAHLVDHVLPHKNIRQWVLTFPVPIRLCLAVRPKVMARALEISHLVTSQYYRKKAGLTAKNTKSAADVPKLSIFSPSMSWIQNDQSVNSIANTISLKSFEVSNTTATLG